MTNPALSLSAHTGYLSDREIDNHISAAQTAQQIDVTDDDGTERTVYTNSPDGEAALEILYTAFLPLLHKAARGSSVLDYEDALMIATEEFFSVVRRYEVGSALPFTAGLATILSRKLGDVGRTSGLIVVRENAAARYRQLMDTVAWDLNAAYGLVVKGHREGTGENRGFTPDTFLSVDRAIGVETLDGPDINETDTTSRGSFSNSSSYTSREGYMGDATPGPEEETVQAETVRALFTLVSDQQESILRLVYGFCDLPTENVRYANGYKTGELLSDRQVAGALGMTTPTVNRRRNESLRVMHAALELVDGE